MEAIVQDGDLMDHLITGYARGAARNEPGRLAAALSDLIRGDRPAREIARLHGVPESTLRRHKRRIGRLQQAERDGGGDAC